MTSQTIYTVGGTVQAGGGVYIKRKADDELLELCRQSEFAFILSSRQVGKSSLMVRTAQQLEQENIRSVTIDLSAIGVNVTPDEWYQGILNEISTSLNLQTDVFSWWSRYSQLGPAQRLTNFFRDVLLKEVSVPIVLFFDEIDTTLSIPFSDDFYVALRAVYNARSTIPEFKRLSFVMVGVAAPSELISDNKRTPFNIGRRVDLADFTLEEALPLAEGLGQQAVKVLAWVLKYTGGHPYLTQRMCANLARLGGDIQEEDVANLMARLFTGEEGKQDNNLQFVRDMLSKRSPDVMRVLSIYKKVRMGKIIVDDERSITKAHLKLSGLVRSDQGVLRVRNEIYNQVFNLRWIQENTPRNWQKTALIGSSAALGMIVLAALVVLINDFIVGSKIDNYFRDFISITSPAQRLSDLASIYGEEGILSNKDSNLIASQLFYGLSSMEEQLAIFQAYEIRSDPKLQDDLIVVVSRLYITVANVDPVMDNTALLQAMYDALNKIPETHPDIETTVALKDELSAWLDGRNKAGEEDFAGALEDYNKALALNSGNHALLYERAKIYIALDQYSNALQDLDASIGVAERSAPALEITPTLVESPLPAATDSAERLLTPPVSGQTEVVVATSIVPTALITPLAQPTSAPTDVVTPYGPTPKFVSNFTTIVDVVNAVRAVMESNTQLQNAVKANPEIAYENLKTYGLDSIVTVADLPLGSFVRGVDISFYSNDPSTPQGIDFEKMKESAGFVFIRAGQNLWPDSEFKNNWSGAKQAGIPRGSYWFYDSRVDPVQQADIWVQQMEGDLGELPLVADFEENYSGTYSGWENWVRFLERVKELTNGKEITIYTGYYYWRDRSPDPAKQEADLEYFHQYSLWIANFSVSSPLPPPPWASDEWLFWQYSEIGDGNLYGVESESIYLTYFNGDMEAFIDRFDINLIPATGN